MEKVDQLRYWFNVGRSVYDVVDDDAFLCHYYWPYVRSNHHHWWIPLIKVWKSEDIFLDSLKIVEQ